MALRSTEIKRKWKNQEKRAAKNLGGRNRPGSGNKWVAPGDVITGCALVSCKRTDSNSISITDKHLKKHVEDALMEDKTPVWEIEIGGKKYYMFCACDVQTIPETGGFMVAI